MKMLRSLNQLNGYHVHALDGNIGKVSEFYFDDLSWNVRYLVVDLGMWIFGRKVLISPAALQQPNWEKQLFPLNLTKAQIKNSPDINMDKPIFRQHEADLYKHYGWEYYWGAEALIGAGGTVMTPEISPEYLTNQNGKAFDPHLRTTRIVTDYSVKTKDRTIGWISDFIVDDSNWIIQHLVVNLQNMGQDKKVLMNPVWVKGISFEKEEVLFDAEDKNILDFPDFDPEALVNKGCVEKAYDYYGKPGEVV
jgi:hypothetical protein